MATPLAELGQNTEIDENSSGETIIRNTQTGTEVRLADFVDIVGPLGDSSNPVAGTSHFESVNTSDATISNSLTHKQINYEVEESVISDDGVYTSTVAGYAYIDIAGGGSIGSYVKSFDDLNTVTNTEGQSNEGFGELTGTDGPDGTINIGIDGDEILIENRSGSETSVVLVTKKYIP